MNLATWDLLVNAFALLFWFRIWTREERDAWFNPQFAPLWHVSESILVFLKPVFRQTPSQVVAAICLFLLLALRGAAFFALAVQSDSMSWPLGLGFERVRIQPLSSEAALFGMLSVLSFAIFLFNLWCLAILYVRGRAASQFQHSAATLYFLSRPFSMLRVEWRPFILLGLGMLLGWLVGTEAYAWSVPVAASQATLRDLGHLAISALAAWVQMLPVLQSLVILLIIGSWVSMFASSESLAYFCREWLDLCLGPLRRYPLRIGILDLTPILFLFGISLVHGFLMTVLVSAYNAFR